MADGPDPFRTLGLNPGASIDEIRRAYRRLAKANHPDSAGEAALPRFLAIQAAYEALVAPTTRRPGASPGSARPDRQGPPWQADPDRARATRENATRRSGRRPKPGTAPGAQTAGDGGGRSRSTGPAPGGRSSRRRPPNTAVPGSTSYDAAEDEPFEPEWSGGTWYGSSSGTYWTINPKEYADPRKHGPEYQRRAQRRVEPDGTDEQPIDAGAEHEPAPSFAGSPPPEPGVHGEAGTPAHGPGLDPTGRALGFLGGFGGRVALALVGWPPIGVALSSAAGEVTGCGRFAASCVDVFGVGTWLVQLAIIVLLIAVPSLAAISATGSLAALAAAVPAAVILSATGGAREPEASAAVLAAVLAIAYLAGVAFATARRLGVRRVPWPP